MAYAGSNPVTSAKVESPNGMEVVSKATGSDGPCRFDPCLYRVFDRIAASVADFISKPWFFMGCALLVLIWAPSYFLLQSMNTWQLIINTITTIVTFLMLSLLQNSQARFEAATSRKLNAIADALADFMEVHKDLDNRHADELREAVGCELPSD